MSQSAGTETIQHPARQDETAWLEPALAPDVRTVALICAGSVGILRKLRKQRPDLKALVFAPDTTGARETAVAIAEANGLDLNKWAHLNLGMQRMNLGNALRGMYNKGKPVVVGDVTVTPAENAA